MPLLFILLLVIGVRSLTLPGASDRLHFLFSPDFSKVTAGVVLTAMGLAFFKLSIGMGCTDDLWQLFFAMISTSPHHGTGMCADLFVSMLAGSPSSRRCLPLASSQSAGPPLLFITIPAVFASIPFGHLFAVLFLRALRHRSHRGHALHPGGAGLGALERFHEPHKGNLDQPAGAGAVGSTCALSSSTLADVQVGGKTFFDLFDFVSSNVLMPLGGIFLCLFVGWVWGFERMTTALTNGASWRCPSSAPFSSSAMCRRC